MISENTLREMVRRIHALPQLEGCMVGFQGNGQSRVLDPGSCETPTSERVIVLIEEVPFSDVAILAELDRWAASPSGSPEGAPNPTIVTNRSQLGPELIGAGLSCGLTIVSAVGVVGGVAGEVPTGGASTFLVVASWIGLTTSAIQCANGLVRVAAIVGDPGGDTLSRWDSNATYTNSILVVDAIGVATGVAGIGAAGRNFWAVLARQRSFAARGLSFEALRGMNRAGRLAAIRELFEEAARTPEGREALILAARQAGLGASTLQSAEGLSVRGASTLVRVITVETTRRLSASLRDVIAGSIGIIASASPSSAIGSASGSLNSGIGFVVNLIDAGAPAGTTT